MALPGLLFNLGGHDHDELLASVTELAADACGASGVTSQVTTIDDRPPVELRQASPEVQDISHGRGDLLATLRLDVECLLEPLLEARASLCSAALAVR